MPLPSETAYWDTVADQGVNLAKRAWSDNSWKRRHQVARLMEFNWLGEKILEIGSGNGFTGHILQMMCADAFHYTGTELSAKFREWSKKMYGMNLVEADLLELPGSGYTRIIAFDSLEHVRPEHRERGYARIHEVAAPGAILLLHFSYGVSHHDKEFDHPFGVADLVALERAGFTLVKYERYICTHPAGDIPYAFVVMKK